MTRITRPLGTVLGASLLALATTLAAQSPASRTHGISMANMDQNVAPGDNFYLYANGGYVARTKLPADREVGQTGNAHTLFGHTD